MILLDDRGGSKDLFEPLKEIGIETEMTRLAAGDLLFEGRGDGGKSIYIGVEYKKLGELVGSLRTGRLQGHQVPSMQESGFDYSFILVEGEVLYNKFGTLQKRIGHGIFAPLPGSMGISELYKRLFTFMLMCGMITLFSKNERDTVKVVEALYRTFTDKNLDEHTSHLTIYHPPTPEPISKFRKTISTFPDIGFKMSEVIEEQFGTIRRAVNASSAEWQEIDGIGPKTARKVQEWMD